MVRDSLLDAIGMGIGFTIALPASRFRELLGETNFMAFRFRSSRLTRPDHDHGPGGFVVSAC